MVGLRQKSCLLYDKVCHRFDELSWATGLHMSLTRLLDLVCTHYTLWFTYITYPLARTDQFVRSLSFTHLIHVLARTFLLAHSVARSRGEKL